MKRGLKTGPLADKKPIHGVCGGSITSNFDRCVVFCT